MKNQHCIDTIQPTPTRLAFGLPPWILVAFKMVGTWRDRARQRRQLAGLGDHALHDIGLTRADVRWEVEKPFWQP